MIDTDHKIEQRAIDALTTRVRELESANQALLKSNETLQKRWNDAANAATVWAVQADEADTKIRELKTELDEWIDRAKHLNDYIENNSLSHVAVTDNMAVSA